MPMETVLWRAIVGLFTWTFVAFMTGRAKKAMANLIWTLKLPVSARPSDLILIFLSVALLMRSGDVEQNPGPLFPPFPPPRPQDSVDLISLSQQMQSVISMVSGISQQNVDMQRQMSANHHAVCQDVSDIKQHLTWATQTVQKNADNIQKLHIRLQESEQYADSLHRQLERLQSDFRRRNVKLTGLEEDSKETWTSLTKKIISVLNAHYNPHGINLYREDIDEAVRVGNPSGRTARPVIISFRKRELARALMSKKDCRQSLAHATGIRLWPDLTPTQHKEMQRLRAEGKRGYLKNGRVEVAGDHRGSTQQAWGNRRFPDGRSRYSLDRMEASRRREESRERSKEEGRERQNFTGSHREWPQSSSAPQSLFPTSSSPLPHSLPTPSAIDQRCLNGACSQANLAGFRGNPDLEEAALTEQEDQGVFDDVQPLSPQLQSHVVIKMQTDIADAVPAATTGAGSTHASAPGADRERPAVGVDDASPAAHGQAGAAEDLPPSPTLNESVRSLRGFGRGSPSSTPPQGDPSPGNGSSGGEGRRGRGRGSASQRKQIQPGSQRDGSPMRTRSQNQSSNVSDKRVGVLSKDWNDIFNRNSPSVTTDTSSTSGRGKDGRR